MLPESLVAAATLITLGCLALSAKVLDVSTRSTVPDDLYPFVDRCGYCPLCNRGYGDGKNIPFAALKDKGGYFAVQCLICGGRFNMRYKTDPPKPPASET